MDGRALVDSKNIVIIFVYFPRRRHRTFCVCARVRALYFSNTPAARHTVIACAPYFVFFFFFLLRTAFFNLQRLPATVRAEARRRACPPAVCACCVRERQPALFRLLPLLLVVALLLLAGAAAAAAAAAVEFCVQPTAAAFPLLLPARGQAFAGAGFSSEGTAVYAHVKKPGRCVASRFCALCFGATYARVCARCVRAPLFTFPFSFRWLRRAH